MPGKLCTGGAVPTAGEIKNSKAFCEGIAYRASGTGLQRPVTDNPHPAGSEAATSWDNGWNAANAVAGSALTASECCAPTGVIPV